MSQAGALIGTWRGLAEATFRYYGVVGRLMLDGVEALLPPETSRRGRLRPAGLPSADTSRGQGQQPVLVLEAEAGRRALGMFVVENALARLASGSIVVSDLTDATGAAAKAELRFSPESVTLEPGEQILVQLMAIPGAEMRPSVRYQGEVRVPGLSGMTVPIVVVRRPDGAMD